MADGTYKEDKTESATGKKRESLRSKGNVVQSGEVNTAISLFLGLVALYFLAPWMFDQLAIQMKARFQDIISFRINEENISAFFMTILFTFLKIIAPVMGVLIVAAFLAGYVQFGWLWATSKMKPKLSGIKPKWSEINIFKKDKIVELAISLVKLAIIGTVVYKTIKADINTFVPLMDTSIIDITAFIGLFMFRVMFKVALILFLIAIIDYSYKRWKHEEDIKMTKQEVKDERKMADGDPLIKSAIRSKQMELAVKRMFAEVPKADVVITNPTHLAIALKYDTKSMQAPKVLAKGKRLIAQRIKEIARENNIPIIEDKPLARAMYDVVEVGMEIPIEFYKAVAKVLAEIYKAGKK